jgi:hypothetical protein
VVDARIIARRRIGTSDPANVYGLTSRSRGARDSGFLAEEIKSPTRLRR